MIETLTDPQRMAADLTFILHRSINWDTWGRRRLKYWDIMETTMASAARQTNSLSRWLNFVCSRMSIDAPGRNMADREVLQEIVTSGQDAAILRVFREEPQLVILLARAMQAERDRAARSRASGVIHDWTTTEEGTENA